ncbi:MAG: Flp pilus assembly protein CpaB [Acidobacteria bacterium]|nr:Flp pilus assembly protein CpaB [Acidobacteriota bacterium]
MQRNRALLAFGVAWLTALLLSWAVYKKTAAPQARQTVQVVAAAADLPAGKRITAADVKLLTIDRKDAPRGAFFNTADVIDRAVLSPVVTNETVLDGKIAAKGGGEGITALIEPGMRAVSVQVNEISGVSGFIQPGTRVDVLFTRMLTNGDAATTTVLQNAKVLAYGKQLEPQSKVDVKDTTKITVATLLVTQEQAEKLALAMQRGRIQLVLRNPLDNEISDGREPVSAADLGIKEPERKPPMRPAPVPVSTPAPRKTARSGDKQSDASGNGHITVRVYRGSKASEDVFENETPNQHDEND